MIPNPGGTCQESFPNASPQVPLLWGGYSSSLFFFFVCVEEKGFTGQGHAETNLDKPT
jgi:hypothetical protein